MENAELKHIDALLAKARSPEEVFGPLEGSAEEKLAAARKVFLHIAKAVHPDTVTGAKEVKRAAAAFKKLALYWEQAQAKISCGNYGKADAAASFTPFTLHTQRSQYTLERLLTRGDLCNLYVGSTLDATGKKRVLLKVPVRPQDNDLVLNEARVLKHLRAGAGYAAARPFLSELVEAFPYEERETGIVRQMAVLSYMEGLFSLQEVRAAYPCGIDARDMAWSWRRLLIALDFAHTNAVIHGCVLPTHVLLHPEQHGVILIDWSYAVLDPVHTHAWISALSTAYKAWYPAEVFAREEPRPGLDIFMAARCMIDLVGGDPLQRTMPDSVPWQIQNHLKGCTLPHPHQRPQDAHVLLQEFDELLARLWGPRTFHPFSMPGR